jgi:hypothetical protein
MKRNIYHNSRSTRSSGPQITGISHKAAKDAKSEGWKKVSGIRGVVGIGVGGEGSNSYLTVYFDSDEHMKKAKLNPVGKVPMRGEVSGKFSKAGLVAA